MKKLLSNWSGRLLILLFPAALIASFLAPANALAVQYMAIGGSAPGASEGDPLDNNDYGGGGGGSDVHDDAGAPGGSTPLVIGIHNLQILIVSDFVGGKVFFRFVIVERTERGATRNSLEGTHAP